MENNIKVVSDGVYYNIGDEKLDVNSEPSKNDNEINKAIRNVNEQFDIYRYLIIDSKSSKDNDNRIQSVIESKEIFYLAVNTFYETLQLINNSSNIPLKKSVFEELTKHFNNYILPVLKDVFSNLSKNNLKDILLLLCNVSLQINDSKRNEYQALYKNNFIGQQNSTDLFIKKLKSLENSLIEDMESILMVSNHLNMTEITINKKAIYERYLKYLLIEINDKIKLYEDNKINEDHFANYTSYAAELLDIYKKHKTNLVEHSLDISDLILAIMKVCTHINSSQVVFLLQEICSNPFNHKSFDLTSLVSICLEWQKKIDNLSVSIEIKNLAKNVYPDIKKMIEKIMLFVKDENEENNDDQVKENLKLKLNLLRNVLHEIEMIKNFNEEKNENRYSAIGVKFNNEILILDAINILTSIIRILIKKDDNDFIIELYKTEIDTCFQGFFNLLDKSSNDYKNTLLLYSTIQYLLKDFDKMFTYLESLKAIDYDFKSSLCAQTLKELQEKYFKSYRRDFLDINNCNLPLSTFIQIFVYLDNKNLQEQVQELTGFRSLAVKCEATPLSRHPDFEAYVMHCVENNKNNDPILFSGQEFDRLALEEIYSVVAILENSIGNTQTAIAIIEKCCGEKQKKRPEITNILQPKANIVVTSVLNNLIKEVVANSNQAGQDSKFNNVVNNSGQVSLGAIYQNNTATRANNEVSSTALVVDSLGISPDVNAHTIDATPPAIHIQSQLLVNEIKIDDASAYERRIKASPSLGHLFETNDSADMALEKMKKGLKR